MHDAFASIVGAANVLTGDHDTEPYLSDLSNLDHGEVRAVVRPASVDEVAEIVSLCAADRLAVTARGGGTGFCGGAVPAHGTPHVVISMERMRAIRELDTIGDVIVAEAGCLLTDVQQAASKAGRLFPISHGGEGSSQIGGMVATNAGGSNVVRYGMARAQILGLEVVLADGTIWNGLRRLRKDNAGYDLKQLFIGSEGTLGIITAAALMLRPKPARRATALVAVAGLQAALALYGLMRGRVGEMVSAFELIPRSGVDLHFARKGKGAEPFAIRHDWMVLIEADTIAPELEPTELLEAALTEALDAGLAVDVVVARSEAQRAALWALREGLAEAQAANKRVLKSDTSVPIAAIPDFIGRTGEMVERVLPGAVLIPFGHIGDGNIHFNVMAPPHMTNAAFLQIAHKLSSAINDVTLSLDGSVAAEHGLGQLKRDSAADAKSPIELDLMRRMKAALDPDGILNPGKILASQVRRPD